ncbi:MAG: alcohol dehydrogenase [Isosphaeraceae bacterium]|jgi:alcohol dehydrogenase class IV|nr:MAG: alcohol dehydrogenase [Isosphaeraceae bacterium]
MSFEFATANRILFGQGVARDLPSLVRDLGRSALVVLGGSGRGSETLTARLSDAGIRSTVFRVPGEPTIELVAQAVALARRQACDLVIAQGGGSVIDTGKAVAGLLANPGDLMDYLEVVGAGKPLCHPAVPWVAVPTTAGAGAEVTRNAVLGVPQHRVKVSLRSPHLLARLALVDPELTLSLPPVVTAATGLDALTQLIEPFVSNAANPLTDGVCREGLVRAGRSLPVVYRDGQNLAAREDMAVAALCGGLALANARLGAVHGFAGVLGGLTGQTHGLLCARLLPEVMEANLAAAARQGQFETIGRYAEIARILTGDPAAQPEQGLAWVRSQLAAMAIPGLYAAGLARDEFDRVVDQARRASSMKGNPVELTAVELRAILEAAFES